MRKRRTIFAGFVPNPGKERLPRRMMFGELMVILRGARRGLDGVPHA